MKYYPKLKSHLNYFYFSFAFPFICTFWLQCLLLNMIKKSTVATFALTFPVGFLSQHRVQYGNTRPETLPGNVFIISLNCNFKTQVKCFLSILYLENGISIERAF